MVVYIIILTMLDNLSGDIFKRIKNICDEKKTKKVLNLIQEGGRGTFVILRILDEAKEKITAGELAEKTDVSTARVARALNGLEKKNYVKRIREKQDKRKVVIVLTDDGKKALEERKLKIKTTLEPLFNNLTEKETEEFLYLLKKILN